MKEEEIEQECRKAEQWREKDDEDKWEAHCQEQEEPCHYDEIQNLRLDLKSEQEYLRSIPMESSEMRTACIDTIVRISDQIEALG